MDVLGSLTRLRRRADKVHPQPQPFDEAALVGSEMTFIDHLEELRWALLKGLAGIAIFVVVALFFGQEIVNTVLLGPTRDDFWTYRVMGIETTTFEVQNRTVSGQFFAYLTTIFAAGALLGAPWFIYQLWRFVAPGLYPHEREGMRGAAVGAVFFLILGVLFGYYLLVPLSLQFFAGFQLSPDIKNQFDLSNYFGMITMWSLGTGALFELPVVIYALAKLGVVNVAMLRKARRVAIVIILIVAAFLTPPDPFSQVLVAIPLLALYELSILLTGRVERRRARDEARRLAAEAEAERAEAAAAAALAAAIPDPHAAAGSDARSDEAFALPSSPPAP